MLVVAVGLVVGSALAPASSEDFPDLPPGILPEAVDKAIELASETVGVWDTLDGCHERGGTDDECNKLAVLCELHDASVAAYTDELGVVGWGLRQAQIFGAFKIYGCGGDCYWCCLTPTGCHTSFGPSPTLNCNDNYGAGSHTVGESLIEGTPDMTDVCLFVAQSCDGYAQCEIAGQGGGLPAAAGTPYAVPPPREGYQVTTGNGVAPGAGTGGGAGPDAGAFTCNLDPNWRPANQDLSVAVPSTTPAIQQYNLDRKLRFFAESITRKVAAYLDGYPSGLPVEEITDLIAYRGCKGYRRIQQRIAPFDGAMADALAVATADPNAAAVVAKRRALVFLVTLRILGSIPNLQERFAYVESRIWPCAERQAYLASAGISDPDAVLLETMGPTALKILRTVDGLQDYRLLAVPRPGEAKPTHQQDGCDLGSAPTVTLSAASADGTSSAVRVQVDDPDRQSTESSHPLTIDWGDGSTTSTSYQLQGGDNLFTHAYAATGRYRITAAVENGSGLHGIAGLIAQVDHADPTVKRLPGFFRVTAGGLQIVAASSPSAGSLRLSLAQHDVEDGQAYPIGRGTAVAIADAATTDLGDLVGRNPNRTEVDRLVIRPVHQPGTSFDARQIFLVLSTLRLDFYSLEQRQAMSQTVTLTPNMMHVYYQDAPASEVSMSAEADGQGNIRIPLEPAAASNPQGPEIDRIEIDLTGPLQSLAIGSENLDAFHVGASRKWHEVKPEEISVVTEQPSGCGGCSVATSR
jgi:hypothetical protein